MSKSGDLAERIARAAAASPAGNGAIAAPPRSPAPAAPQPPGGARQRTVRLTFDLDPELHRALRMFALDERTDASKVIRAFVQLLNDPAVRQAVLEVLHV